MSSYLWKDRELVVTHYDSRIRVNIEFISQEHYIRFYLFQVKISY